MSAVARIERDLDHIEYALAVAAAVGEFAARRFKHDA